MSTFKTDEAGFRHNDPPIWVCYVGVGSKEEWNAYLTEHNGHYPPEDTEGFIGGDDPEKRARDFADAQARPCYVFELQHP